MGKIGEPSANRLAQAGYITNEAGRVFEPSFGVLSLPWIVKVSKEAHRRAREALASEGGATEAERFGWFIASTEAEFKGLKFLLEKDWRRALKAWKENKYFNLHNKATLHRALFYSGNSQKPDAHLRECLRLYHFLSEKNPEQPLYRQIQEEMIENLKQSVVESHRTGDDKSAAKSMKILARTVGPVGVTHMQIQFFGRDLDKFCIDVARVTKELLSYQGLAHAPPVGVLERCDQELTQVVLPEAARFSRKLVEGSKELNKVEELMAQTCGILSQSYSKAGDNRGAKRWLGEALRWEPSAVADWRSLPDEDWGDEESAVVKFPEKVQEKNESPTLRGSFLAGVQVMTTHREAGESREECLESVFLAGIPLFPTRRFACYRNLDTGEVGYYLRIPMTAFDHIRQGISILLLSFLLTFVTLMAMNGFQEKSSGNEVSVEVIQEQIAEKVEKLKELAQKEAKLAALSERSPEQDKKLDKLRAERIAVIKELEELEKRRAR
jgi:hypothetical protein